MKSFRVCLQSVSLGLFALAGLCPQAQATLLTYDGFNYTGGLSTQNGGSGWSDAWGANNTGGGGSFTVASSGLTYSGLTTGGNAIFSSSGTSKIFRTLSASTNSTIGTSVYISVLLSQSAASFGDVTLFSGTTELFSFGDTYTGSAASTTYSIYRSTGVGGGGYTSSGVSVDTTSTAQLLVMEINYVDATHTNLYLYLDPTISATAPDHTSSIISSSTSSVAASFIFDRIRLEGATTSTLDELRIGTTFADVVGMSSIPEPSSYVAVFAAGCLGAAVWRRKRGGSGDRS
ncbi:MAG TPA: PEP-CTERM sorting domain-containing protein [Rariglobus sp.]|nr:PEP-CTERM sorting domain-containing protein [Rariglobus sp.]